jgi:hypothetical protein
MKLKSKITFSLPLMPKTRRFSFFIDETLLNPENEDLENTGLPLKVFSLTQKP